MGRKAIRREPLARTPRAEGDEVKPRAGDNRLPTLAEEIRKAHATVLETEKRGERG
jgi:hypothetical protein